MEKKFHLVFTVENRRYALPAADVVRVSLAAELTSAPDGLPAVRGIANVGGEAAPVADLRKKDGPSFPEMEISDRFVFFRNRGVLWGIIADDVEGTVLLSTAKIAAHAENDGITDRLEVAFTAPGEPGILLRTAENILTVTDEDLLLLDRVLSRGGEQI